MFGSLKKSGGHFNRKHEQNKIKLGRKFHIEALMRVFGVNTEKNLTKKNYIIVRFKVTERRIHVKGIATIPLAGGHAPTVTTLVFVPWL